MPFKKSLGPDLLIALLLGVGLVWLGRTLWLGRVSPRPVRLVLKIDGSPWPGFSSAQERGLVILVADSLEVSTGMPVVFASDLLEAHPAEAAVLGLHGSRDRDSFTVDARLAQADGKTQNWRARGAPKTLFHALLEPFRPQGSWEEKLVPAATEDLGILLEITGWESDWDLGPRLAPARELLIRTPGCASAWLALAGLEHRGLVLSSNADPQGQEKCQEHFQQALAVLPAYPRCTHNFAIYLTDIGNQREALSHLETALKRRPRVAELRSALAYVARTAGLLDVGLEAVEARDRLQGLSRAGGGLAENVHLYRGDLNRFSRSLGVHSPERAEPVLDFYRGYVHLLKGDQAGALAEFRQAATHPGAKVLFESLAEVYLLGLEGRTEAALALLNPLRDQRLRLRVPDGEFTFKLAEAYCFLGREDEALLVAERAFSQGFGCTRWYETTPLLAPLRGTPRWRALLQHLKDRQFLLESRFPPSRFR